MRLLDRYIVFRFLRQLFWALAAAAVIFLSIDMVEQLDRFIDARVPTSTVLRYYALYIPYIVYLVLPVATLLATLFTIGGMALTNELSAMHTSGVPFMRTVSLLLIAAAVTALGGFVIGETVVPDTNRHRMDIMRYEVKRMPRESRGRYGKLYFQIEPGKHLYIDRYSPETKEAFGIQIVEIADGRIGRRYDAPKMVWRDRFWYVQNAIEQTFGKNGSTAWKRGAPLILDGAGLSPDEFEKVQIAPEEMNWAELKEFIEKLKSSGGVTRKWEVDLMSKVALPVAAVIIVLFGAPLAAVKRRGGAALGFGLSLFVCFIYFGFIQVGKVLGYGGEIPPLISAWMGNIFFGFWGLVVLARAPK